MRWIDLPHGLILFQRVAANGSQHFIIRASEESDEVESYAREHIEPAGFERHPFGWAAPLTRSRAGVIAGWPGIDHIDVDPEAVTLHAGQRRSQKVTRRERRAADRARRGRRVRDWNEPAQAGDSDRETVRTGRRGRPEWDAPLPGGTDAPSTDGAQGTGTTGEADPETGAGQPGDRRGADAVEPVPREEVAGPVGDAAAGAEPSDGTPGAPEEDGTAEQRAGEPEHEPEAAVLGNSRIAAALRAAGDDGLNPDHLDVSGILSRGGGGFSPKARFEENLAAIETLKRVESEGRRATRAERETMARYNGWGGLSEVFNPAGFMDPPWVREGALRLRELLTEEEYTDARASVNNAFFTSPELVRTLWETVRGLGFRGGRVLDPAAGVGAFIGAAPADLAGRSRFTAIEKDGLTGRMLRLVQPDADVRVAGFEETDVPALMDLVITNVPFGEYRVFDPEYPNTSMPVHDLFAVKALDKLRPGGIAALITSTYTMDKKSANVRRMLHRRGILAGAVRLPSGAHAAQAGTDVATDVLFLVRRENPPREGEDASWTETVDTAYQRGGVNVPIPANRYFVEEPDRVLGRTELRRAQYGRLAPFVEDDGSLSRVIEAGLFDGIVRPGNAPAPPGAGTGEPAAEPDRTGLLLDRDRVAYRGVGTLMVDGDDDLVEIVGEQGGDDDGTRKWVVRKLDLSGVRAERLRGLIGIRDAMDDVVLAQVEAAPAGEAEAARATLNERYDAFVQKHGPVNLPVNRRLVSDDPEYGRLIALEHYDDKERTATKADIFSRDVIDVRSRRIGEVVTPEDALAVSVDRRGAVDPAYMASLVDGVSGNEIMGHLLEEREVFLDPRSGRYVIGAQYLSGNVRAKLKEAGAAAQDAPELYGGNVEALRAVIPEDLGPSEIVADLGSVWIPTRVVQEFISELLEVRLDLVDLRYRDLDGRWTLELPGWARRAGMQYGTARRRPHDIIERALNGMGVEVYDQVKDADGGSHPVFNAQETTAAREKLDAIQEAFREFLWRDPDREQELVAIYNERFNAYAPPKYDGSRLGFPGMTPTFRLRDHQRNAVMRAIFDGKALFAHDVGTGKTAVQIATAMELKRLGRASRPLVVVPNHMLEQFSREAQQIYPTARILTVSKKDLHKDNRRLFLGRAANNDWDAIVITHRMLERLSVPQEFEEDMIASEIADYRAELETGEEGGRSRATKRLESRLKSLEARLKKLRADAEAGAERGIDLAALGVDAILIDESHNFKNLEIVSHGELGRAIQGSKRAWDMYLKTRYIYDLRGDTTGVFFSSATPVSNNLLEILNLMRYLQPDRMREMGLNNPSAWGSVFLESRVAWEPDPSGTGWRLKTRFALKNVPELIAVLRNVMDVVTTEDAGVEVPGFERHNVVTEMSTTQVDKMAELAERAVRIRAENVDPSEDNLLKIVSEGRKAALDVRLLDPETPSSVDETKVGELVRTVAMIHDETDEYRGTQMVFCDLGTPGQGKPFVVYDVIRDALVEEGVPAGEIAYIHDATTDEAKERMFENLREGRIRILLGSTPKMGEGVNGQTRMRALHHLDPPWRPSDIEQREGRIVRQGNRHEKVDIYIYTTKGSMDTFMWSTLKRKADEFTAILKGESGQRTFDSAVDPTYGETLAITTNNPLLKERLEVEQQLDRLVMLRRSHAREQDRFRGEVRWNKTRIGAFRDEIESLESIGEIPGNPNEWTVDLTRFGKEGEYRGDRQGMLQRLSSLLKETDIRDWVGGFACGGVPVKMRSWRNDAAGRVEREWAVDREGCEMVVERPSVLENTLSVRDARIRTAQRYIAEHEAEMEKVQSLIQPFDRDQEIADLEARMNEILAQIEEAEKVAPANAEADGEEDEAEPAFAASL